MLAVGFEPTISAGERPQTYTLEYKAVQKYFPLHYITRQNGNTRMEDACIIARHIKKKLYPAPVHISDTETVTIYKSKTKIDYFQNVRRIFRSH